MSKPPVTLCLWYDKDAEEAAQFYAATFPDSAVGPVPVSYTHLDREGGHARCDLALHLDAPRFEPEIGDGRNDRDHFAPIVAQIVPALFCVPS